MEILYIAIGLISGLVIGAFAGFIWRKKVAEAKIGSAEKQATELLEDAIKKAETRKKETLIEAKEEIIAARNEAENELKERRKEVSRLERRIQQKEELLDRKTEAMEKKEQTLQTRQKEADDLKDRIQVALDEQLVKLEKIAGMTREEAKAEIMARLDSEIAHETALKLSAYESQFREDAEAKARDILSQEQGWIYGVDLQA